MKNLLKETIDILEKHGRTLADIEFFTNGEYDTSVGEFVELARDFYYEEGYGTNYINDKLVGVGVGFILIREEYDGAEWWRYVDTSIRLNAHDAENVVFSIDGVEHYYYPMHEHSADEYNDIINDWKKYNERRF